jgi:hypothetical protein
LESFNCHVVTDETGGTEEGIPLWEKLRFESEEAYL